MIFQTLFIRVLIIIFSWFLFVSNILSIRIIKIDLLLTFLILLVLIKRLIGFHFVFILQLRKVIFLMDNLFLS